MKVLRLRNNLLFVADRAVEAGCVLKDAIPLIWFVLPLLLGLIKIHGLAAAFETCDLLVQAGLGHRFLQQLGELPSKQVRTAFVQLYSFFLGEVFVAFNTRAFDNCE